MEGRKTPLRRDELITSDGVKRLSKKQINRELPFELDEEKALHLAFGQAQLQGKMFDIHKWKMAREKERVRLGIKMGADGKWHFP